MAFLLGGPVPGHNLGVLTNGFCHSSYYEVHSYSWGYRWNKYHCLPEKHLFDQQKRFCICIEYSALIRDILLNLQVVPWIGDLACKSRVCWAGKRDKLCTYLLLCAWHVLQFKTCLDVWSCYWWKGVRILATWPGGHQRPCSWQTERSLAQVPQKMSEGAEAAERFLWAEW